MDNRSPPAFEHKWSFHDRTGTKSDYTIANLKEIDDSAGEHTPRLEAHFGRKHLDSQHLGVSHFRYGPGFRSLTGHNHREQ